MSQGPSSTRRREIVAIAAGVFARKGLAGATVRDIADEAGILSGSLYHHFESKEEMIAEVLGEGLAEVVAAYRVVAPEPDPALALRRLLRIGVAQVHKNPNVARILRNDGRSLADNPRLRDVAASRSAGREVWDDVVARGMAAGVFRADVDAAVIVRVMLEAVLGTYTWFPPAGDASVDEIADQLADLFLAGLVSR